MNAAASRPAKSYQTIADNNSTWYTEYWRRERRWFPFETLCKGKDSQQKLKKEYQILLILAGENQLRKQKKLHGLLLLDL